MFLASDEETLQLIEDTANRLTLNEVQRLAFRIIALQTVGQGKMGEQLRMGLFGEGGTGKSRVVEAIREWFRLLGRSKELVVTGTMGVAARNIGGGTVHSALGIPVEQFDRRSKVSAQMVCAWTD